MQARHIGATPYFTKAQLEANNPSRLEGIDAVAEARWRSTTSKLVKAAIKMLKLPDWVYETAMNYINRFFLSRSISKNDRHLVVGGAILLASKVQESPRSVQDVAYVLMQLKNANKQKQQLGPDQMSLEQSMEGVVLAEQAMLFSLNFNLNVETHVSLARRLLEPLDLWAKANPTPEEAEANQLKLQLYGAVMFFLNDSALTNLSLQYPNYKVAPVTLVMAAKRIVAARYSGKEVPVTLQRVLALASDASWFESKGLTLEAAADIEAQINELYATAPVPAAQRQQQAQAAQGQPPAAAASTAGAASAVNPRAAQPKAAADAAAARPDAEEGELPSSAGGQQAASGAVPSGTTLLAAEGNASPSGQPAAAAAMGLSQPGQPTSSAAVGHGDAGAAAGTPPLPPSQTPCHPSQQQAQQQGGNRASHGEECNGSDQQVTSELHAAPEPQPEAEAAERGDDRDAGAFGGFHAHEDSVNGIPSPDGLTNGNASGSGCGHAEGQAEVSSRQGASCQALPPASAPQSPSGSADAAAGEQPRAKRGRSEADGEGEGDGAASGLAPPVKLQRLDESAPAALLQ